MPSIAHLVRPDIAQLEPYTPIVPFDILAERLGRPVEDILKLDANENPYGPSPRALAALHHEAQQTPCPFAIYPDPEQTHLRAALSRYCSQPVERIVCGAGADELIDMLLRLFLHSGDAVLNCPPTFGMYAFDTAVCGGRLVDVPRHQDFSLDVAAIEQAASKYAAKVLFLASPNNPDGSMAPNTTLERLLQLPLLVVVDEAYVEFSGGGVSSWVGSYDNLVVLRTFSKWAGLAGLRIGYALLPEPLAEHLWKMKQPYNVSVAAQTAAIASLADVTLLQTRVQHLCQERERVAHALRQFSSLSVYPSHTNFLLCRMRSGEALALKQSLEAEGILIRYYRTPALRDCIRISIGLPEQNDRVLEVLRQMIG